MVVFTCNHCGESLQKPRVEKHYAFQCRKPKSLTCVDCFKDFKNEEFTVHTKCVTEEERYSAKGSIPGGVVKKGDVKQESWTEMIQMIVKNAQNLKPSVRNLFNTISMHTNVPRKRAKFINFLKSSTGGRVNYDDIEAAWNLIEKYKNETSKPNGEQVSTEENGLKQETNAEDGSKKKKRKIEESIVQGENEEAKSKEGKTKKRKKQIIESTVEGIATENGVEANGEEEKLKKKQEQEVESVVEDKATENVAAAKNREGKTKKKKQMVESTVGDKTSANGVEANGTEANANKKQKQAVEDKATENGASTKSKEGKTRKKKQMDELSVEDKTGENEVETKSKEGKTKKKKQMDESTVENKTSENGVEAKGNGGKTTKKRQMDESTVEEKTDENGVEAKSKEGKTKKKKQMVEIAVEDKTSENQEAKVKERKTKKKETQEEESAVLLAESTGEEKFSFKGTILKILSSKSSIPCKKLEKKVFDAYVRETGNTVFTEKTIKKYNKKLKKIANISIEDDNVSLLSNGEQ